MLLYSERELSIESSFRPTNDAADLAAGLLVLATALNYRPLIPYIVTYRVTCTARYVP